MRKFFFIGIVAFIVWFIPWVLAFHLGTLVYFPYKQDGQSRYIRMTGPLAETLGLDTGWTDSAEIPLVCRAALIVAEDGKFLEHNGIDTESIKKAIERNKKKRTMRGGSTITQQLVKNAFLYREKTYFRKAREIVGAVLLDFTMSKKDQITWYLNIVEFGPQMYGLKAASKYYFDKSVKKLSLGECASLISILRDPKRSSRFLKSKNAPSYLFRRQQMIIASVLRSGILRELKDS